VAWIEVHQSLQRHPKLLRLSAKLRIHRAQSAGHLLFLWLWTLDYAPSGDLSAFGPAEISAAADYPGDAEIFAQALRETGWIEANGYLHDWHDYAGKLIDKREEDRKRKEEERRKKRPPDVHRTSEGNPCDGAGTVPYPTVPYPTKEEENGAAPLGLDFRLPVRSQEAVALAAERKHAQSKPKKDFEPDSLAFTAAVFFWDYVKEWAPQARKPSEAGFQAWAKELDLMFRLDERTPAAFNELLDWIDKQPAAKSGFSWRKNVLSPATLRQRWKEGKFADFLPSELGREEFR
jgi:hypothetical protein